MLMNHYGLKKDHLNRPILNHIVYFLSRKDFLTPILSVRYTLNNSPQNVSNYLLKTFEEEYWYFISFEEKRNIEEIFKKVHDTKKKNLDDFSTDDLKKLSSLLNITVYNAMKRKTIIEKLNEKMKEMKNFSDHVFSLLQDLI